MQLPAININGTSKQSLLDQYQRGWGAVNDAISAIQAIEVHGRDYQTIANSNAASDAIKEHRERLSMLRKVRDELEKIMEHIHDS
jgi:hypothetical protein